MRIMGTMQEHKFEELETRASASAELDAIKTLEARSRIRHEIERMKAEGEAMQLTDEERMTKHGQVFTWQSRMPEGVQIVEETALVAHPSEVG